MPQPFLINFPNGQTATGIRVSQQSELEADLSHLGLHGPRPILVIVGGASNISEASFLNIQKLFVKVLAPIAETLGAYVVDGGTDAGVMKLIGQARREIGATFPLIGVCPFGKVSLPDDTEPPSDSTQLEPNHTHFVFIPGNNWGDESPWIVQVASELAAGEPSVTLLLNGGEITIKDAFHSVIAGRLVIVIAGSGRTADKLSSVMRGEPTKDRRFKLLADSGLLQEIDLSESIECLAPIINELFSRADR